MPLDGDTDVGVGDAGVLLEDAAGFGGGVGPEVVVFVAGEVGAWEVGGLVWWGGKWKRYRWVGGGCWWWRGEEGRG